MLLYVYIYIYVRFVKFQGGIYFYEQVPMTVIFAVSKISTIP